MTCREYIFRLTSGQPPEAAWNRRADAALHRMMCRRCRAFTRNDARLDQWLAEYRQSMQQPEPPDGGAGGEGP